MHASLAVVIAVTLAVAARATWLQRRVARANAALAASESALVEALRMGDMGRWEWEVRTSKLTWSDEVYRIFGFDAQYQPTHETYIERVHPDDRERLAVAVRRAVLKRTPYRIRHRIVRLDGEVRTLNTLGEVHFGRNGEPDKLVGICQDVTEYVRLQEQSEEQERKLRNTLDTMFAFVAVFSTDGAILDANRALLDGFGLDLDRLRGVPLWDTYPWSYSREAQNQARDLITRAAKGEIVRGDFLVRAGGGTTMTVDVIFGPLRDRDGRIARVIGSGVDVTARKQAEEAVKASEARLAQAQRIAGMGSWEWNILTNDLVWSDQIYRIFGLESQQFVPTYPALLERIHPEDRGLVEEAVGRALKESVPYDIHHRVVRADGGVRVVREQGEITLSSDGRPVRMLGTCQDVTERVRLEEDSEEQRLLLRNTLDSMFAFVGVCSTEGVLIDVNRALMDAFGLSRDEIIGTALWNTYAWSHSPEAQQQARDALTRAAQGEIVRGDFVVRVDAVTLMTIDVIFGPLRDRDGRIARVIASGVDVTARKQAEEEVKASEARLRTILESEPECVKVLGADCRLLDMNAAGLRMIGATSIDQVRGNSVLDLMDPKFRTAYADGVAAVFAGQTTSQQFEIVSLDGTRRWMDQHAAPLFDQGNPGKVREMIAVTRDVTERVRIEQLAREVREALEQAQRIANIGSWEHYRPVKRGMLGGKAFSGKELGWILVGVDLNAA